jgi:hypothetical protein
MKTQINQFNNDKNWLKCNPLKAVGTLSFKPTANSEYHFFKKQSI